MKYCEAKTGVDAGSIGYVNWGWGPSCKSNEVQDEICRV